jgi:hypothetical protein
LIDAEKLCRRNFADNSLVPPLYVAVISLFSALPAGRKCKEDQGLKYQNAQKQREECSFSLKEAANPETVARPSASHGAVRYTAANL